MALTYYFKERMGTLVVKQHSEEGDRKFKLEILSGNALAIFVYRYKDEKGEKWVQLYNFWADKQHVLNQVKAGEKLIWDEVVSIELNMVYKKNHFILDQLTRQGYKVKCYYKEIK